MKYFSNHSLEDAIGVKAYLEDSLAAFPKSSELKTQMKFWNEAAASQKDMQDYACVEEKWKKSSEAKKRKAFAEKKIKELEIIVFSLRKRTRL